MSFRSALNPKGGWARKPKVRCEVCSQTDSKPKHLLNDLLGGTHIHHSRCCDCSQINTAQWDAITASATAAVMNKNKLNETHIIKGW